MAVRREHNAARILPAELRDVGALPLEVRRAADLANYAQVSRYRWFQDVYSKLTDCFVA